MAEKECVRDRPVPTGTGYLRIVDERAGIVLQPTIAVASITGLGTAALKSGYVFLGRTVYLVAGAGVHNVQAAAQGTGLLIARALGAGGGGAGVVNPGPGGVTTGGGGGAGEYAEFLLTGPAASYAYVVGAGGLGGAPGLAGAAGGFTRLGPGGSPVVVAQGGLGAPGQAAPMVADAIVLGAAFGGPGGYDFSTGMNAGEPGIILGGAAFVAGGRGAHSLFGAGGDVTINGPGVNAAGPGGGGSGGSFLGVGGSPGGNGADGLLIVEEYA